MGPITSVSQTVNQQAVTQLAISSTRPRDTSLEPELASTIDLSVMATFINIIRAIFKDKEHSSTHQFIQHSPRVAFTLDRLRQILQTPPTSAIHHSLEVIHIHLSRCLRKAMQTQHMREITQMHLDWCPRKAMQIQHMLQFIHIHLSRCLPEAMQTRHTLYLQSSS